MARDHLFEMAKLGIEALKCHLERPYTTLCQETMDEMIEICSNFPAFTEKQVSILQKMIGAVKQNQHPALTILESKATLISH